MADLNINIDYETVFLKCYHHLLRVNDDRYKQRFNSEIFDIEFLYGGRDSGKSRHVAMQLIIECIFGPYFKCLLIRKVLNTVRGSQYDLINSIIDEWGLKPFFSCNETRLEIIFKATGNGFYGRGLDDVGRIKSFNNPSHAWVEEGNQITQTDFVVILTSLRADQRVKTYFSFNPECEMNYLDFWLYQEWFAHNEKSLSWTLTKTIRVQIKGVDKDIEFKARATHTTYKDNPYCQPQRIALYESYSTGKNNAYWYQTYTLGLWGFRRTGGEFWKCFDEALHTTSTGYEKTTLHVVADNNVVPYVAISLWQVFTDKKIIRQVAELPCRSPDNTASKAAIQVLQYMARIDYNNVAFIYGDPSANARSTTDDAGKSFFDKFIGKLRLSKLRVIDRVQKSAPDVELSGSFVNEIYESQYDGWKIEINAQCRTSIEDYIMAKETAEGNLLKKRITDKETKQSFEKYGHFSDCKRYFITTILATQFANYKQRRKKYFGV